VTFELPAALLGLALVPLALAAYLIVQRRRRRYAMRFTNLDLLANVVTESPRFWRRHLPPLLTLLALAALVIAVARPHVEVQVPKERATVMLATDVSGSMQATDVQPDRLTAAREAAKRFSERLPKEFRLGLVSFNQQSQLLVPPVTDRDLVRQALDGLSAGGGTAMGDALENSLSTLRELAKTQKQQGRRNPPAVVVLLSDGKNTGGSDPLEVARQAKKLGVPINTVALGTDAGIVELTDPEGFLRTIPVPPDRDALRQIARTTDGRFFEAKDAGKLDQVYQRIGSRIGHTTEKRELTAAFAGAGLGLLVAGSAFSLLWFGRLP
jgi:Ca-activated chloride channel homolog